MPLFCVYIDDEGDKIRGFGTNYILIHRRNLNKAVHFGLDKKKTTLDICNSNYRIWLKSGRTKVEYIFFNLNA